MVNNEFIQRLFDKPLQTIVDYYAHHLSDAAHIFLAQNCLSASDTLRVGFSDRTFGKQLPEKRYKLGREIRAKLRQVCILKRNGHESLARLRHGAACATSKATSPASTVCASTTRAKINRNSRSAAASSTPPR